MHNGVSDLAPQDADSIPPPTRYENKNVFRICGDAGGGLARISHAYKRFALEAHKMILREHGQLLQVRSQTLVEHQL